MRALPDVMDAYLDALPWDVELIDLDAYDKTGVPVVSATPTDHTASSVSVGYGSTRDQAVVGALGEMTEGLVLGPIVAGQTDQHLWASFHALVGDLGEAAVVDPRTLALPAGSHYDQDVFRWWTSMTQVGSGQPVMVPLEFVVSEPGELPRRVPEGGWLITPITNGLGAGLTEERAVSHALLEVLQRDGNTVDLRALDQGTAITFDAPLDAETQDLLDRLAEAGVTPIVKLASTEFVTVVHCVGRDTGAAPAAIAVTGVGEAAHPDREQAVRKAILEFAASRARRAFCWGPGELLRRNHPDHWKRVMAEAPPQQEHRALQEMTRWADRSQAQLEALIDDSVLAIRRRVPFSEIPTERVPGPDDGLLDALLGRLGGFDVLKRVEWTADRGVAVAKVLVPRLEVETMSYNRIGERVLDRLLERDSELVAVAPASPGPFWREIVLDEPAAARFGAPAWLDLEAVRSAVGELYPMYREPSRHSTQWLAHHATR